MEKQFLPYSRQELIEEDIRSVNDVLKSDFLTQGSKVPEFEEEIKKQTNASYAVAMNSATSALHVACMAIGLTKNDWLWTVPNTFVASANCAIYCNASVDFIDIKQSTGLIDIEVLDEKLSRAEKDNKLPKVVIPVHFGGSSCEMEKIAKLSKKYGFFVIEDGSHALGGLYKDTKIGCCKYSDICIFSFHPVKIITSGEGGAATTNKQELARKMEILRSHGIVRERNRFILEEQKEPWRYEQQILGYNYRMSDIHAALGLSQIRRLSKIVVERNKIRNIYCRALNNSNSFEMLTIPPEVTSAVHLAVVLIKPESNITQMNVYTSLREKDIGAQIHYIPVHLQPFYRERGFKENDFPESEKYAKRTISIPVYPGLREVDQERVIDALRCIEKGI